MNIEIHALQADDIETIASAFQRLSMNKPAAQYKRYWLEQEEGRRTILVAFKESAFVGYLTIVWRSDYPPFQAAAIPEIQDFNVLPEFRRQGVGTQLMDKAEQIITKRAAFAGIGVGLTADYGAAQRLYVLRGYVPDGRGLVWKNHHPEYGDQVTVDDDLVLCLVKRLPA